MINSPSNVLGADDVSSTIEVAKQLGLAVRSVQLMVDRGELEAWKTAGGHRRISRASVQRWIAQRRASEPQRAEVSWAAVASNRTDGGSGPRVLLIEDSRHHQNLVTLLIRQQFPHVELSVADDGIGGLALAGQLQPDVLLVDIQLPGIDGVTLITGLRSNPAFARSRLIVITSLEGDDLEPYVFVLNGVPVVHKSRLVSDLPVLLGGALPAAEPAAAMPLR